MTFKYKAPHGREHPDKTYVLTKFYGSMPPYAQARVLNTMKFLKIIRPDDWHVHFRDQNQLNDTVSATAKTFSRALVMPNLVPPLVTLPDLLAYKTRVLSAVPQHSAFTPYFTLYLNDDLSPQTLLAAKAHTDILGAKLYPAHATTHTNTGAKNIHALYPLFDLMQSQELVLQIHGEHVDADIFDREAQFITTYLTPLIQNFPKLRVVLEHISTQAAVEFVNSASPYVTATITPHHLMYNRNDLLHQGIKPHLYCLPILKRQSDQAALMKAAISGNPKYFAGTDSAPHPLHQKESACGCAGIFSAPYAVALYAQLFDACDQLSKLENFMSCFGAHFYRLPINDTTLTLHNSPQTIPLTHSLGHHQVVPIAAGEILSWSVYES